MKPGEYLNQSIEVIATNFRIGKIDAASLWEPTLSRIATDVGEGTARIVADGSACDNPDLGILNMRADFVKNHRDVAKGYLRAELEAQRYMLDPANWENVINMVSKYATGHPEERAVVLHLRPRPSDSFRPRPRMEELLFRRP